MIWQPIETAPKDGTWVLLALYNEGFRIWEYTSVRWSRYCWANGQGAGWIEPNKWTHWTPITPPERKQE